MIRGCHFILSYAIDAIIYAAGCRWFQLSFRYAIILMIRHCHFYATYAAAIAITAFTLLRRRSPPSLFRH